MQKTHPVTPLKVAGVSKLLDTGVPVAKIIKRSANFCASEVDNPMTLRIFVCKKVFCLKFFQVIFIYGFH